MTPSEQIDKKIVELTDWRGDLYIRLRELINNTDLRLKETWKWDTAVWRLNGNICALGVFKGHVKLNFFKGAQLQDSKMLFNSGLDSKEHRSINFAQDSPVPEDDIRVFILQAIDIDSL
ncbi:MAG: DUF1801 domain-containing protein [Candidatus Saccharimonadales bacterium]